MVKIKKFKTISSISGANEFFNFDHFLQHFVFLGIRISRLILRSVPNHGWLVRGCWDRGIFCRECATGKFREEDPDIKRVAERLDCAKHIILVLSGRESVKTF